MPTFSSHRTGEARVECARPEQIERARARRAAIFLFLLLVTQLACRSPLPGPIGAAFAPPRPIYTLTSLPPFPTATAAAAASATPLPSRTATHTSSPAPTRTATPVPLTLPVWQTAQAATTAPDALAAPAAPVIARYLTIPPRLDGDWAEWKGLTDEYPANTVVFGKKKWTGPDDLSASFRLGWDEDYLYLGVKVHDDQYVQAASGADLYNGDSLELLLDTRRKEDAGTASLSDDDFQLGISPGHPRPGIGQGAYLWTPNYLAGEKKTIQVEASQESGMYRLEAAIPWSIFEMRPVAGQHYGFAISVGDTDDGDSGVMQSMVSNLPARHPADPTTWGDLQLVKLAPGAERPVVREDAQPGGDGDPVAVVGVTYREVERVGCGSAEELDEECDGGVIRGLRKLKGSLVFLSPSI